MRIASHIAALGGMYVGLAMLLAPRVAAGEAAGCATSKHFSMRT